MLFVMGVTLCTNAVVFAEDVPGDEPPELYDGTAQVSAFDIGTVDLSEDPEPEPEPDPEPEPAE